VGNPLSALLDRQGANVRLRAVDLIDRAPSLVSISNWSASPTIPSRPISFEPPTGRDRVAKSKAH